MPRNWASFSPHSLPVVPLRLSGTIVRALADTGAAQSLIDPVLVKQLALKEEGTGWIVGIAAKPLRVPLVSVSGAAIGQSSLSPFKAGILSLMNLRIGIQIILGVDAFRGYRLQFDWAEGKLYLLS